MHLGNHCDLVQICIDAHPQMGKVVLLVYNLILLSSLCFREPHSLEICTYFTKVTRLCELR